MVGLLLTGPVAALGFLAGTLVGGVINMLIDFLFMRRAATASLTASGGADSAYLNALPSRLWISAPLAASRESVVITVV